MLCWEWVCVKQRRYCFVAIYPLAARNCLFTGVSVHDTVFDFSHQLIHRWPRERSSAIRNLRPARLPQLGDFGTISQVPQPRAKGKYDIITFLALGGRPRNSLSLTLSLFAEILEAHHAII